MLDWNSILTGVIIIGIGGLGVLGRALISVLTDLRVDFGKMAVKLEANSSASAEWQKTHTLHNEQSFKGVAEQIAAHEAHDQTRFEMLDEHIARIDTRVDAVVGG